jgi:hypothetical protein
MEGHDPANTIERMRTRILGREGSDQTKPVAEGSPWWEADKDLDRRVRFARHFE